jgi:multicomponent Na+:H+ antiporter subunit G
MKELIVSIFILSGTFFIMVASLGLIRFRDIYSRMHATTKATSFGILLIVIGVGIFFSIPAVLIKAVLIILFIYLTAPLAAHAIGQSYKTG